MKKNVYETKNFGSQSFCGTLKTKEEIKINIEKEKNISLDVVLI